MYYHAMKAMPKVVFHVTYNDSYEWDFLKIHVSSWKHGYSCEGAIWIGRCENIGLSAQLLRCQKETDASYFNGWRKLFSMQLWMCVTIRVLLIKSNNLFSKSTLKENIPIIHWDALSDEYFYGAKALLH